MNTAVHAPIDAAITIEVVPFLLQKKNSQTVHIFFLACRVIQQLVFQVTREQFVLKWTEYIRMPYCLHYME
jgi:hypothetical protein